ncbi:hypothetical protein EVA_05122 [gut metagenome]|uniref:Uncharacterized protein n=1 Tax=gut metagenome TaxID=749906 RepID=J9GH42_9ZZZZ
MNVLFGVCTQHLVGIGNDLFIIGFIGLYVEQIKTGSKCISSFLVKVIFGNLVQIVVNQWQGGFDILCNFTIGLCQSTTFIVRFDCLFRFCSIGYAHLRFCCGRVISNTKCIC